jgi:hypothetical protein
VFPPDAGVGAELVDLPRRQRPREYLGRPVRVRLAGLLYKEAMDWDAVDAYPQSGLPQVPTAFPLGAAAISMTPAPAGRVDSGHGQRLWTTPVDNGGVVHTSV